MAPARSQGTVSASIDEPNSSAMNPKISVNRLMKIPNCAAYARTFQNPIATQTQMAARTSAQNAWPHCASGNDTAFDEREVDDAEEDEHPPDLGERRESRTGRQQCDSDRSVELPLTWCHQLRASRGNPP